MKRPIVQSRIVFYNQYTRRNCLTVLFYFMLVFSLNGQVITGTVTSGVRNEPLPGVTVVADDSLGTQTDSAGNYRLLLSAGDHRLEFRLISFRTEQKVISLKKEETLSLNISMSESAEVLGVVVISAGKFEQRIEDVTVSMEVLKPDLIEKRSNTLMDEAVDYIPGVNVIDGQANIRGGSGWSYGAGSRVQVLVDDLPQLSADAGDAKWNFYPLENLEQVEVIKGASSVLFGSSALNGVINIRTAYPRETPQTKINAWTGLYDHASITTDKKYSLDYQNGLSSFNGVNFFHSRKIKRLDLVFGGNFLNDNGYRQGENEMHGRLNVNLRYNFKTPGLSAGVNVNSMISDATLFFIWKNDTSGAYVPAENTLSESKTYRTSIDPFVTYVSPGGSIHKLRCRWFGTNNENNTDQDSRSDLFFTEYQYQKKFFEKLSLTTGIVSNLSKVNSELYGDHNGSQLSGYLQGDLKLGRVSISAGMRAEQNKVDDVSDELTPVFRSGVNYHVFKETYLRASVGQGYRFPSIAEKYIRTDISGVNIFPNPDLLSEEGLSMEAAVRQGFRLGHFIGFVDFAVFQNNYYDMIEFVFAQWETGSDPLANLGFKSINVGDTRIRGLELTTGLSGSISKDFSITLQGGYTYLDPRQLTYDSMYVQKVGSENVMGSDSTDFLKYRYQHMVRGDLEFVYRKISFGTSLRYTSFMENIDRIFTSGLLDALFPPGLGIQDYRNYHRNGDMIIDMRAGFEHSKNFRFSIIVKNVFNHIYMQRPGDMQPPRAFMVQATFSL
jgi:iron complex outermembrane receptor protein